MAQSTVIGSDGFDWDQGNINKNWKRHGVSDVECEQVFFNQPIIILPDVKHSVSEERFLLLGRTDTDRLLFVVFSVRAKLVRVISARDMNRKEKRSTKHMKKQIPKFKNEEAERKFWATHDSTAYVNWADAKKVIFPDLKPTARLISIRLPESMIQELKSVANKWDVPYQSLLKMFLAERLEDELRPNRVGGPR